VCTPTPAQPPDATPTGYSSSLAPRRTVPPAASTLTRGASSAAGVCVHRVLGGRRGTQRGAAGWHGAAGEADQGGPRSPAPRIGCGHSSYVDPQQGKQQCARTHLWLHVTPTPGLGCAAQLLDVCPPMDIHVHTNAAAGRIGAFTSMRCDCSGN
jgi:hypothetical protein